MRQHYDKQRRFDSTPIGELSLNFDCRDEVIPVLAGLQYIYTTGPLRRKLVTLVAKDMNHKSRRDVGRPGLDDWQIVVLAAVRLGLNYDYDKLQDQAENHRSLQIQLGIGDWEKTTDFRARRICDTAYRRVILGESVPNSEKLFSLFEPHTQLYRRGKAGEPNQFGRLVLVFEDGAGFLSHYHLMDRNARDADVVVEETRKAQKKHQGRIETASFDRGFYSAENEAQLSEIVNELCLAPRQPGQFAERLANASVEFHRLRQRHPGIESAIGALQSGNGLKRCRDHSELGFERYLGLAILGRNIQTLGKLLIAKRQAQSAAAFSKRKTA